MTISISIFDRDESFIASLSKHLAEDKEFTIRHCFMSYKDALDTLPLEKRIDAVLIGADSLQQLSDATYLSQQILNRTTSKIILISSLEEEEAVLQAFAAGAVNYICKNNSHQIPDAIRTACKCFNPMGVLIHQYYRLKQELMLQSLSKSEREIFDLLMQGYTQTQIRQKLVKSIYTVRNQISRILKKLEAANSKEAVDKVRRISLHADRFTNRLLYIVVCFFSTVQLTAPWLSD